MTSNAWRAVGIALILAFGAAAAASAQTASLSIEFTNRGEPLDDPSQGRFYVYEEGKRERYLAWGNAVRPARVPAGTYDVVIRYVNGTIVAERVLEAIELAGQVERKAAFEILPAYLTVEITAGGAPIDVYAGSFDVYVAGRRGEPLASHRPGERVTLRAGRYDVEVRYRDPGGLQSTWLRDYLVNDDHVETVDIGVARARLRVALTYRGVPVAGGGEWEIHRPGDPQPLNGGGAGERLEVPAGTYDLRVVHDGLGDGPVERWVRGVEVAGDTVETVELYEDTGAEVLLRVTRAGSPLDDAWCSVYPAGQDVVPVAGERSGRSIELPAGTYDVHCTYRKGTIRAEGRLRNQALDGPATWSVDLPLSVGSLNVQPPRRVRGEIERPTLLVILDSSLEMQAPMGRRTRMETVARTLVDALGASRDDALDVGVRVWGISPRERNDCRDSTAVLPVAPLDVDGLERALRLMRPSGYSPIGFSLLEAAQDLPVDGRTTVLVITGSRESCNGDACDAAARLIKRGRADRIHVVALDTPKHAESEFDCIGTLHPVANRAQLRSTLRSVLREATRSDRGRVTVFEPGRNRWVASAELGQAIPLIEGRYDVMLRVGDRTFHWNDFEVRGEVEATAGRKP